MAENITYYAVLSDGTSLADPSGLARRDNDARRPYRRVFAPRPDVAIQPDAIYQWERGENFGPDLVEISAEEAAVLVERFRQRWAE